MELNRDNKIDYNYGDYPKVIFENASIIINVAKWLGGILNNKKYFKNVSYNDLNYLSDEEIFNKIKNHKEMEQEVALKMREILSLAGINSQEVFLLKNFNKDNMSFDCCFRESDVTYKINLIFGDFFNYFPEIIIEKENTIKRYNYLKNNDNTPKLDLYVVEAFNDTNKLKHRFFETHAEFVLSTGNNKLTIQIKNPNTYVYNSNYILDNEDLLMDYLLNLDLPSDIKDIYKKICEITGINVMFIPNILIREEVDNKTIGLLSLSFGLLNKVLITKNGIQVMVDGNNNWSYDTDSFFIKSNSDGYFNFNLKRTNIDKIRDSSALLAYYEIAQAYVKDTRNGVKKLIKKM